MLEIRVSIDVDAPPEQVFEALTDWARQGEWMPGTSVRVIRGAGDAEGDEIVARTAAPGSAWASTIRCASPAGNAPSAVRCCISGGSYAAPACSSSSRARPDGGSRYTWAEWVEPPFGRFGQAGLRPARRPIELVLRVALRRFARWVEQER